MNIAGLKADGEGLTPKKMAVFRFTDAMMKNVEVSDDLFHNVKMYFTDRKVVEITATIAAYNCCSRFLVALDFGEQNGKGFKKDVI